MEKIIIGKKILKTFGKNNEKIKALDEVNIEIVKGEFISVMGSSGSGKSTLLFALSGMDNITSGTIQFGNIELSKLENKALADIRRTKMGFIFQQPTMLKNLNILDNIIISVQGNYKNNKKITDNARKIMKKTGIDRLGKRDITEVSGGQLQRAGICRALINSPEILFADEPTGALNSKAANEIMNLLVDINKDGTTILLVTHDAKVASRGNRVLFMKDGKIVSNLCFNKSNENNIEIRMEKIIKKMKILDI